MGHTRSGLCLPSPCACIISQAVGRVKGFLKLFSDFFRRADLRTIAMASPCSALSDVPCEGWGSLPSPDMVIIHLSGFSVNPLFRIFANFFSGTVADPEKLKTLHKRKNRSLRPATSGPKGSPEGLNPSGGDAW